MDYNLIEKKFLDKWIEHIKHIRIKANQSSREAKAKAIVECPYKKLKTRGTTYPKVDGGFAMGLTLVQLAKEMGFKTFLELGTYIAARGMPKPIIEVIKDGKKVKIYDSDTAKKISEYILYSYKKPSKLIESYNEYTEGNNKK